MRRGEWFRSRRADKVHRRNCRYADPRLRWTWAEFLATTEAELDAILPPWTTKCRHCFGDREGSEG